MKCDGFVRVEDYRVGVKAYDNRYFDTLTSRLGSLFSVYIRRKSGGAAWLRVQWSSWRPLEPDAGNAAEGRSAVRIFPRTDFATNERRFFHRLL